MDWKKGLRRKNMWMIISDTHDNMKVVEEVPYVVEKYKVDSIFHCGDFVAPFVLKSFMIPGVDFFGVFGNNDGEKVLLSKKSDGRITYGPTAIEHQGKKIFMMHEPYSLMPAESSGLYDYVFFGHTHEVVFRQHGKTLIINPGEACGWVRGVASCVLLEPDSNKYVLHKFIQN